MPKERPQAFQITAQKREERPSSLPPWARGRQAAHAVRMTCLWIDTLCPSLLLACFQLLPHVDYFLRIQCNLPLHNIASKASPPCAVDPDTVTLWFFAFSAAAWHWAPIKDAPQRSNHLGGKASSSQRIVVPNKTMSERVTAEEAPQELSS